MEKEMEKIRDNIIEKSKNEELIRLLIIGDKKNPSEKAANKILEYLND